MPPIARPPRLLVSVRNAAEARAALEGGCDIVDVKEPERGSLGMADAQSISDVLRTAREAAGPKAAPPVSAALGELREWPAQPEIPRLPAGLDYMKLGLAGMAAAPDWRSHWLGVRRRFDEACRPRGWVAVAYADWQAAEAPPPEDVILAAIKTGCAAVLFDTFGKSGRGLPDWIPGDALARCADEVRRHGLSLALAGSLRENDLPRVLPLQPDIIAIRTAACAGGARDGDICARQVAGFRAAMRVFSKSPGHSVTRRLSS